MAAAFGRDNDHVLVMDEYGVIKEFSVIPVQDADDISEEKLVEYLENENLFYPILSDRMKEVVRGRIKDLKKAKIRTSDGKEMSIPEFVRYILSDYEYQDNLENIMVFGSYLFSGDPADLDIMVGVKCDDRDDPEFKKNILASNCSEKLRHDRYELFIPGQNEMPLEVHFTFTGEGAFDREGEGVEFYGFKNRQEYLASLYLLSPVAIFGENIYQDQIEKDIFVHSSETKLLVLLVDSLEHDNGADLSTWKILNRLLHAGLILRRIRPDLAASEIPERIYSFIEKYSDRSLFEYEKAEMALEDLKILRSNDEANSVYVPYLFSMLGGYAGLEHMHMFDEIEEVIVYFAKNSNISLGTLSDRGIHVLIGFLPGCYEILSLIAGKSKKEGRGVKYSEIEELLEGLKMDGTEQKTVPGYKEGLFLDGSSSLISTLLTYSNNDVLLRVPVEIIESVGAENIDNVIRFLNAFQSAPNGYVELYYMTGTRALIDAEREDLHGKYKLNNKAVRKDFKSTTENTISLFALLKGQDLEMSPDPVIAKRDIRRLLATNIGHMDPEDTQVVPLGLKNDPSGLLRSTILGLELIHIARHKREYGGLNGAFVEGFVKKAIAQYEDLSRSYEIEGFDWETQDMIDLATGGINTRLSALKKLIDLLPVTLIDPEELTELYEYARNTLVAA